MLICVMIFFTSFYVKKGHKFSKLSMNLLGQTQVEMSEIKNEHLT